MKKKIYHTTTINWDFDGIYQLSDHDGQDPIIRKVYSIPGIEDPIRQITTNIKESTVPNFNQQKNYKGPNPRNWQSNKRNEKLPYYLFIKHNLLTHKTIRRKKWQNKNHC
jgi:hypothetical protein